MEGCVGALADRQLDPHGSQLLHEVGVKERRWGDAVPEVADRGQLRIVSRQEDLGARQSNFCDDVQQRSLAHKALVKAQRALAQKKQIFGLRQKKTFFFLYGPGGVDNFFIRTWGR